MNAISTAPRTITFDARPAIAAGEEPLSDILKLSETLVDGDTLEVIAPFDPRPLYDTLSARGFRVRPATNEASTSAWHTRFTRVDISDEHTVAGVRSRHPATAAVFATFGLDSCCGGAHTLAFAARAQGVDLLHLLATLQQAALHNDGVPQQ
jgi:uncharacterized protein (DUF2249 family)